MAQNRTIQMSSIVAFLYLFITSFTLSAQNSAGFLPLKTLSGPAPKASFNPMPQFSLGPTDLMNELFVTAPVYFTEYRPIAVAVGDFNGDGNPDVAVANECQMTSCDLGSVSVFLGNGDGTLQPAVNYPSGDSFLTSVNVGDFNGDGKLDLIVVNRSYPYPSVKPISIFLGRGDGTFAPPISINPIGGAINALAVGDFNSDGKLDIAVTDNQAVAILFGNGNASFQPPVYYPAKGIAALVTADLNHDGQLDLIVSGLFARVAVMLGNRDGTFSPITYYDGGGTSMAVADVNGDGRLDVMVAQSGSVGVLLGNGDGTLQPELLSPWPFYEPPVIMATGDFNRDGRQDLAAAQVSCAWLFCETESLSLLLGNGDGTFQEPQAYAVGTASGSAVAAVDFNGDSKPDLVVVGFGDPGSVSPLLGNGDGTFRAPLDYLVAYGSSGGVAADFNGDNKLDLAVAQGCLNYGCGGGGIGGVSILLGNGNGTLQKAINYSTGYDPSSVAAADFNGDKKLDLAVVNTGGSVPNNGKVGSVSLLLGNGDGTFQPAVNYATEFEPTSIAVGDFNGDGKLDLAVSNMCRTSNALCSTGSVSFLFGNGDGTFKPALNHSYTGKYGGALVAGDFNGDGKTDLALGTSGAVVVWLGKGNGSFRSTSYSTASQPRYIAAGDLNGDGKTDLVFSMAECPDNSCATGLVSVLLGNGDGTFQSPITVSTEQVEFSLLIADFDGDGRPDVIAESYNGESSILLGNGDGSLRASSNLLLPFGHDLVMGDFNADGKPDFTVDGAGVAVLLNVAPGPFHYATAVDLKSSLNPAYVGQKVTLSATVTPAFFAGTPSGDMTFNDNGSPLATVSVSGGKGVFSTSSLNASTHKLTASYSGDSKYAPQWAPTLTQIVSLAPTTTTLTSSPNPSLQGQTVIFTATVTSAGPLVPTGKVVFKDGTTTVGSKTLSGGIAVLNKSTLAVGSHSITAVYYGDTASAKSASSVLTQIVN
jgi:hypothetical protein